MTPIIGQIIAMTALLVVTWIGLNYISDKFDEQDYKIMELTKEQKELLPCSQCGRIDKKYPQYKDKNDTRDIRYWEQNLYICHTCFENE